MKSIFTMLALAASLTSFAGYNDKVNCTASISYVPQDHVEGTPWLKVTIPLVAKDAERTRFSALIPDFNMEVNASVTPGIVILTASEVGGKFAISAQSLLTINPERQSFYKDLPRTRLLLTTQNGSGEVVCKEE